MVTENGPRGADMVHQGHHTKTDERFFRMLRRFPPSAQEFVTGLSSSLLERDVYEAFRSDPDKVAGVGSELRAMGLGDEQVHRVLRYFNLTPAVGSEEPG